MCMHAPSGSACPPEQCAWVEHLDRTLGLRFNGGGGWGNLFSYFRNLHEFAAVLGRRLLLSSWEGMPTDMRLGNRSWKVPQNELSEHVARSRVVNTTELTAGISVPLPVSAFGTNLTTRRRFKWEVHRFLNAMDHQHIWLDLDAETATLLERYTACPDWAAEKRRTSFLRCLGRLATTPALSLAGELALARQRMGELPYVGVHIRTFGVDATIRDVDRSITPDRDAALELLAWDMSTNASDYAHEIRWLCNGIGAHQPHGLRHVQRATAPRRCARQGAQS